jgi:hypothetical protein
MNRAREKLEGSRNEKREILQFTVIAASERNSFTVTIRDGNLLAAL